MISVLRNGCATIRYQVSIFKPWQIVGDGDKIQCVRDLIQSDATGPDPVLARLRAADGDKIRQVMMDVGVKIQQSSSELRSRLREIEPPLLAAREEHERKYGAFALVMGEPRAASGQRTESTDPLYNAYFEYERRAQEAVEKYKAAIDQLFNQLPSRFRRRAS